MNHSKVLNIKRMSPLETPSSRGAKPVTLISVGRDPELLRQREALLARTGIHTRSALPEQAETDARSPEARVWVFCSTVEAAQVVYLACSVRRYSPNSKLLLIEGSRRVGFEASLFDRILKSKDAPEALLPAVSDLAIAS